MSILLAFVYVVIGAIVAFSIYYLRLKSGSKYYDESFNCVMIGIFWPVAAPIRIRSILRRGNEQEEMT